VDHTERERRDGERNQIGDREVKIEDEGDRPLSQWTMNRVKCKQSINDVTEKGIEM